MKLIDQITIKADCVEFFLRDMAKQYCDPTYIVDVIMKPQNYQEVFDKWRIDKGYDPHPMDRPNRLGSVKSLIEPDECDKYHAEVDEEAMRRAMK